MPMPAPSTSMYSEDSQSLVVTPRWESKYRPTVMTAVPMIGKIR